MTTVGSRRVRVLDEACTEKEWQATVLAYARLRGWLVFHPFYSMRSTGGWPDLAMVRAGQLVFAELKSAKGKITADQERWRAELAAVPGITVRVWRPSHWDDVQRVLL